MARYKLILEYDGTALIGFQKNKDGPSVQSLVEEAIYKFSGQQTELVGCGRTDAGVHAIAMPAHFDMNSQSEHEKLSLRGATSPKQSISALTVKRAINFYLLNYPVSVTHCEPVADTFHARFDCLMRHYKYVILNQDFPPVFEKNRCWHIPQRLDITAMKNAARQFIGNHDFTSFRATACQAKSPIKTINSITITCQMPHIIIEISARSFLHHMVRNIVGTLVEIGLGKPHDIPTIMAARDRSAAGPTAPSRGLFFIKADY